MPGKLRFDRLDVRQQGNVNALVAGLASLASRPQNRHSLTVAKKYYFASPNTKLPAVSGWYIICDDLEPIYVGTAENLNARLNTENGSRDQFANPQRESDPERNFIKSFHDQGVLKALSVITITEPELCAELKLDSPLTKRDRLNVEKILNLFRNRVVASRM